MASMSYRELRKLLESRGCQCHRDARHGGHEIWRCPGRKQFSVPKNLKGEGTLQKILKDAGIKE
jgi:predicted RNA binding protein YcfA (HicA-like mRNA interferase family)